jgi:hypothetical protein
MEIQSVMTSSPVKHAQQMLRQHSRHRDRRGGPQHDGDGDGEPRLREQVTTRRDPDRGRDKEQREMRRADVEQPCRGGIGASVRRKDYRKQHHPDRRTGDWRTQRSGNSVARNRER